MYDAKGNLAGIRRVHIAGACDNQGPESTMTDAQMTGKTLDGQRLSDHRGNHQRDLQPDSILGNHREHQMNRDAQARIPDGDEFLSHRVNQDDGRSE